jgi:hypothetical protein
LVWCGGLLSWIVLMGLIREGYKVEKRAQQQQRELQEMVAMVLQSLPLVACRVPSTTAIATATTLSRSHRKQAMAIFPCPTISARCTSLYCHRPCHSSYLSYSIRPRHCRRPAASQADTARDRKRSTVNLCGTLSTTEIHE